MSIPDTHKVYRRTSGPLPRTIEVSTEPVPKDLGPKDVLIKVHTVSLNFRDVGMLVGRYPIEVEERGIPCSDAAAEVVATGSAVTQVGVGDHVSVIFDLNNLVGGEDAPMFALGGDFAGVLREYAVYEEKHLVPLPKYLNWEEAATIACAGVTAWSALNGLKSGSKPRSALLQGTGGVSMFALLICLAAGVKPIITSSSDKKLQDIRKDLGDEIGTINYKKVTDQAAEVSRLTDGKGVDYVINNTGPASIPQDISFLRQRGGQVSLVGFLEGFSGDWQPGAIMALMSKNATLKGTAVGSREDFIELNKFLTEKNVSLSRLVDKVFSFDKSPAAFDYLLSGSHVGKVIIKVHD
ncbi:NAD(P)-binding protein [Poronia punctata]|nr:NAD(P)-binding protein [Poronia punctata]